MASQIALCVAIMDQYQKFECASHGTLIVADLGLYLVIPYLFRK